MAKFRSIFRVSGDIGDVTFYEMDGQKYVRQSSSLDKDRIMRDPAFRRTRENMMEFGGAATAGKSLRKGLAPVINRFADHGIVPRLTGLMKRIGSAGNGIRGKRPIEILPNKSKLEGLNLHKSDHLEAVFVAEFDLTASAARDELTLDIPVFNIDALVRWPEGATHFKIILAAAALSDHIFDDAINGYVPVDPDLNGIRKIEETAEIPLAGMTTSAIQLVATLPGNPLMTSSVALVGAVGIEFYQETSGSFYVLATENAMLIPAIF